MRATIQLKTPKTIEDLVADLVRAVDKPQAEREIALPLVVANIKRTLADRYREAWQTAEHAVGRIVDDAIMDTMSAPGLPAPLAKVSPQDALSVVRRRINDAFLYERTKDRRAA